MYTVEFYEDVNGKCEVEEYLDELSKKATQNKSVRIRLTKILTYIKELEKHGTRLGYPFVRHIEGDLWELRPLSTRVFFFYWKDNKFILLHHFEKKTKKTPPKEIKRALREMKDWKERGK